MRAIGVIPARYESSRFPGKPLADIRGSSMIKRVYTQACQANLLDHVMVASDDKKIIDHCKNEEIPVVMTSPHHQSGTDRIAEVAQQHVADYVVNIQGDEPLIPPYYIDLLVRALMEGKAEIATLATKITDASQQKKDIVKVVTRADHRALYFSRSTIPYVWDPSQTSVAHLRHMGIYAFQRSTLLEVTQMPQSFLEKAEKLEQLRWLENGYEIEVVEVPSAPAGVDTPADLARLVQWMIDEGID